MSLDDDYTTQQQNTDYNQNIFVESSEHETLNNNNNNNQNSNNETPNDFFTKFKLKCKKLTRYLRSIPPSVLMGYIIVISIVISIVVSSEATNAIMKSKTYDKPFFVVYCSTVILILAFPIECIRFFVYMNRLQRNLKKSSSISFSNKIMSQYQRQIDNEDEDVENNNDSNNTAKIYKNESNSESVSITDDDINNTMHNTQKYEEEILHFDSWKNPYKVMILIIKNAARENGLTVFKLIFSPIPLSLLWFLANYTWFRAIPMTDVPTGTTIYQASTIFVFLMSIVILREVVTLAKVCGIALCIGGVILVTWFDGSSESSNNEYPHAVIGDLLMLLSSFLYPLYEVLFKKWLGEISNSAVNIYSGFLGIWTAILYWPGIIILNVLESEVFVVPRKAALAYVIVTTFLSFVITYGVNWGVMLTTPLFLRVGVMCTIPITILIQLIVYQSYKLITLFAATLVISGFALVSLSRIVQARKNRRKNNDKLMRHDDENDRDNGFHCYFIKFEWI